MNKGVSINDSSHEDRDSGKQDRDVLILKEDHEALAAAGSRDLVRGKWGDESTDSLCFAT